MIDTCQVLTTLHHIYSVLVRDKSSPRSSFRGFISCRKLYCRPLRNLLPVSRYSSYSCLSLREWMRELSFAQKIPFATLENLKLPIIQPSLSKRVWFTNKKIKKYMSITSMPTHIHSLRKFPYCKTKGIKLGIYLP